MTSEIRRAKKTFNVIATTLIDQLLTLFEGEQTLIFFRSELDRLAKDKKQDHVPAANFFNTMNIETKIPPSQDAASAGVRILGDKVVVGELIIRKDDRLFGPDAGVTIPALEALGLKGKWPELTPANRELVWDYLIRMAKCAAQVVLGMQMMDPQMQKVMQDLQSKSTLRPGASEAEFNAFAKQVQDAVTKAQSQ